MAGSWVCTCGPLSGGTRTGRSSATWPSPRTSGIRRVLAREGGSTVGADEGQACGGEIAIEAVDDLGVTHVVREL